jgi:hypothetical protein
MSSDILSLTANSRDNGDMSNKKEVVIGNYQLQLSPKAYGLFKVTASKFTIPKVETMRKSYYLKDNIYKVKSVLEKISNILIFYNKLKR